MLQVCSRLVRDFASSESSTLRLAYVDACGHLFDPAPPCGCSRDFVKAHHLHSALQMLATDPVPNVRLATCALLPALKRTLRLPADADALQRLYHAVSALQSDGTRDVRAAAAAIEGTLRSLEVLADSSTALSAMRTAAAVAAGGSSAETQRWEADDAQRRAEEEALTRAEQEAVLEAKRRAGNELAERARAAYALKIVGEGGARRLGEPSGEIGGFGHRASRIERANSRDTNGNGNGNGNGGRVASSSHHEGRRRRGSMDMVGLPGPGASSMADAGT